MQLPMIVPLRDDDMAGALRHTLHFAALHPEHMANVT
jgi:hypothetical protein